MKKENINVTINGDVKDPLEIIFREGDALRLSYPKKYSMAGVITAPAEFAKRFEKNTFPVVEYSYNNKSIKFFEDPTNPDAAEVTGILTINPDLVAFGINKNKYFSSADLIKHVRNYAHCFESLEDAKVLIQSLQNFDVKFEQQHIKKDDRSGNTEESVKNAIKFLQGDIKRQFKLSLPFFIGTENVSIEVEVEIERQGTTPVFGFYSLTLEKQLQDRTFDIINGQMTLLWNRFTCLQIS